MDLVELFERGGPLMWVILAASAVGAAVFLERLWAFRGSRVLPRATLDALARHLEAGDVARAGQLCREQPSALARIAEAGLRHRQAGRAAMKEAMEERGQVEVGRLSPGLGIIATVAAIAPLLGLLGTVTGMIQVFRDVAGVEHPDVALLAGGIWQALITTGAGLSIAIPFFIGARYLEGRVDRYAGELEEASLTLLDRAAPAVRGGRGAGAAPEGDASPATGEGLDGSAPETPARPAAS